MNVLVTGGAGYIGTELVYELSKDEIIDQIVVYDNLSRKNYNFFIGNSKFPNNKVRFVHGDILNSKKLKEEINKATIVYHLAAKVTTPFANQDAHGFDQVNNWGTSEVVYLVENSDVEKFIYTSSASVYGSSGELLNEDSNLNPDTYYSISKKHGEEHVRRLLPSRVDTLILRLGNVYGYSRSMRLDSVINKFMFEANFTRKVSVQGDGNQTRSFVHIDRLTQVLKQIGIDDYVSAIYNVAEESYSINEIVDHMRSLYSDLEILYINQNMKMRSLNITSIMDNLPLKQPHNDILTEDLKAFKSRFTF